MSLTDILDEHLSGKIALPVWKDFQSRQGVYGSLDGKAKLNGEFGISVGGDMFMENPTITAEHINAFEYLSTHAEEICDAILARFLVEYKNLQEEYGFDQADAKEVMPDVEHTGQFKDLIGLSQIHLMNVSKDNFAYVGYEFGCNWDDEHGIGFMTHKSRVVAFGGGDTSFLTWVAEEDLEK